MRFEVDHALLGEAGRTLAAGPETWWIIGGACAGKSTISRIIAQYCGLMLYDVDAHMDGFPPRCRPQRHPVLSQWFGAPDPFAWLLGLPPAEFEQFNRASTPELLDLICRDVAGSGGSPAGSVGACTAGGVLVDGGITGPALLAQAVPVTRVVCLEVPDAESARLWEEDPERRTMREMVLAQPGGEAAWRKFLLCDRLINAAMRRECRESGIRIVHREPSARLEAVVAEVMSALQPAAGGRSVFPSPD